MNKIRAHTHLAESLAKHGTLRYVSSSPDCSTYVTAEGDEVWLHHGTAVSLVYLDDIDWEQMWQDVVYDRGRTARSVLAFLDDLKGRVVDPEEVNDLRACSDCFDVVHGNATYHTGASTIVCEDCYENYWGCDDCEESYPSTNTINDREVCDRCLSNNYYYCDDCESYYDPDLGGHNHDRSDCCASPAQAFRVRNNGDGWLANDTRTRVGLPAGHISEEGFEMIGQAIREWALVAHPIYDSAGRTSSDRAYYSWANVSYRLEEVGAQWQTKQGNFTKRLSRFAYQEYQLKVPPEVVSRVGNIAREQSNGVDFDIEVTRNLNLPREHFVHEGSCWWSEYAESRCALKTNGGFGLRSFVPGSESSDETTATGRAWVMPLRRIEGTDSLVESFDTEEPDAFVVFNGYGVLNNYIPSRVMAHMYGWTYRKIGFEVEAMYINDDSGYLVAPEELAESYTDGSLSLDLADHSNLYERERARAHSQSTENTEQREHANA